MSRLCVVTPRFGADFVGGAEAVLRSWAEHLAKRGHEVSAITTCARDHHTWANVLAPGETTVKGVRVSRYPVSVVPDVLVRAQLFSAVDALPRHRQEELLHNTGFSQPLLDAIARRADDVDAFIFGPYLYPSTVFGARVSPEKSLVMPALHDEGYARFTDVRETLSTAAGLLFLSEPEAAFAHELLGDVRPHRVVGTGVSAVDPGNGGEFHRGINNDFIAYAGRRESGKNYELLVEWMAASRSVNPAQLDLVSIGTGVGQLPAAPRRWLHNLDAASESQRQTAMAASVAVANLSVNESFSLVLMEAWLAGAPVIAHADGAVTRYHCERSGGGLWVGNAEEFAEATERLRSDRVLRDTLGRQGRAYVEREYSWPVVMERLEAAITELVA